MDPSTFPAIKRIQKLTPDDRFWRVDWFCGISGSPNIASDRLVDVIISPFKQDSNFYEKPASTASTDYISRKTIKTSIGNLPYIHIGSVWKNGEYQNISNFNYSENFLHQIAINNSSMRVINADHRLDNGSYLIDKKFWPISVRDGLNSKCLCVDTDHDPYGIIIPMMEVIRFYYATSSKVIQHLISDSYFRTGGNCIFDRSASRYLEGRDATIHLRKDFESSDAWAAARLAFDETAHENAIKIYTSIAKDWKNGFKSLHPETLPPFTGKTTLLTYGKKIKGDDGKWRFLVFWVSQCSAPFPFNKLSYTRDNPGDLSRKADKQTVDYPSRVRRPEDISEFVNQDEEPPSSQTEVTRFTLPPRFTDLADKKLHRGQQDPSDFQANRSFVKTLNEKPSSLSTSPPTSGESRSVPAGFSSNETKKEIIYNYDRLVVIIKGFNLLLANNIINTWQMLSIEGCLKKSKILDSDNKLIANTFPNEDRNGIELPRHFTHHHTTPQRGMMVIEMTIGSQHYYLFEILRREKERFAAVLVIRNDFCQLDQEVLKDIIIESARNEGRWLETISVPGVNRYKVNHRWKSSAAFAKRIEVLIRESSD